MTRAALLKQSEHFHLVNSNTRYLLGIWFLALASIIGSLFELGVSLWKGDLWGTLIPVAAVLVLLVVIKVRMGEPRIRQLLQSNTAESLVTFYERALRKGTTRDVDAYCAHNAAISYILYGDFTAAKAELQSIDWKRRLPLTQASGLCIEALLCYFETHEYERGLQLARSAQELGTVSLAFPGAKKSAATRETYLTLGEVLCGRSTPLAIASLESNLTRLHLLVRLFAAYGLSVAYRNVGDVEKAETMQAYIQKTAPNCKVLLLPSSFHTT